MLKNGFFRILKGFLRNLEVPIDGIGGVFNQIKGNIRFKRGLGQFRSQMKGYRGVL